MSTIHLIEGPVGAGKSTYAERLSVTLATLWLNLDEWMVVLFRPDRPEHDFIAWYHARKERCIEQIWRVAVRQLETGSDVILELGLVQTSDRQAFYRRVDGTGHELKVHVLEADRDTRQQRVRERNSRADGTFQMVVSDDVFALADRAWQAPDGAERRAREIEFVTTG